MDLFTCMQNFVDIVDHGGLTHAAEVINVPPSALSKRLSWLEGEVDSVLVYRTTRRFDLSEAGEKFYQHAKKILAEVNQAKKSLVEAEPEPHGVIRLALPETLDAYIVSALLKDFLIQYPKITVTLASMNSPSGVVKGRYDMAFASTKSIDKQLARHVVFKSYRAVFASPAYLERFGTPKSMADLTDHNCLLSRVVSPDNCWRFARNRSIEVSGNLVVETGLTAFRAAATGVGLIWASRFLLEDLVETGELVELELDVEPAPVEFYLYTRRDSIDQNTRLLLDFFCSQLT